MPPFLPITLLVEGNGPIVRRLLSGAATTEGNTMDTPGDGRASTAYNNASSNAEGASEEQDTPPSAANQAGNTGAHDK